MAKRRNRIRRLPLKTNPKLADIGPDKFTKIISTAVPEVEIAKALASSKKTNKQTIGKGLRYLFPIILIVLIVAAVFLLGGRTDVQQAIANFGKTQTEIKESTQGAQGSINVIKQLISGNYQFAETWKSDTQKVKYEGQEVGVKLENVEILRDSIFSGDNAIVTGTLKSASLPASATGIIPTFSADISASLTTPGLLGGTNEQDAICTPNNIEKEKTFFDRISCEFGNVKLADEGKKVETKEIKLKVNYDFEVISGKTIYALRNSEYEKILLDGDDPFNVYNIDKKHSWQTTSEVGVGIGLQGEADIFGTNNKENIVDHYIGVTVENKGSGKLEKIDSVLLIAPKDIEIKSDKSDFIINKCDNQLNTCDYTVSTQKLDTIELEPGSKYTFFLVFQFPEDGLQDRNFEEQFVMADVKYRYSLSKFTTIQVNAPPA